MGKKTFGGVQVRRKIGLEAEAGEDTTQGKMGIWDEYHIWICPNMDDRSPIYDH